MRSIKSTIGGAFSALGSALMGVGILPQLSGNTSHTLTVLATIGFCCNAIGTFLGHLFAADARELKNLSAQVEENKTAIETTAQAVTSGDTTELRKSQVEK